MSHTLITMRQLRRLASKQKLQEWSPAIVTSDGKQVAVILTVEQYERMNGDRKAMP